MTWLAPARQWVLLIALSAAIAALLLWLHAPAALMLGPLSAAMILAARGVRVRFPVPAFVLAQGVIGCLIAKMVPLTIMGDILGHWLLFTAGVLFVVAASSLLGWLMTRLKLLPGTTALWGTSPGAASIMTIMAESYGADIRLVAVMQYLRVVLVAAIAAVVAKLFGVSTSPAAAAPIWFPPIAWLPFLETLALAVGGPLVAWALRIPAGAFLVPMVAGIVLTHFGLMTIELPTWLLAACYALVGWNVGLRFTRGLHPAADRALRPGRGHAGLGRRRRSSDGLSCHQSRRLRFDRHHRRLDRRRCLLRDGHADGSHDRRAVPRACLDQIHRRTFKVVR